MFDGVQMPLPSEAADQMPIPPVRIISLGSSSAVEPVFAPFKKSISVLLIQVPLPPSPGKNARDIPFWFVHKLGPSDIGTTVLSALLWNIPPATAFATYVFAVAASTFEMRIARRSISELPHFFHLAISPL